MKKSISILSFAALASAMVGIATASPASASICKRHGHKVVGLPYVNRTLALRSAIKRWSGTVRSHDGLLFANWRFAQNRGVKFSKVKRRWRVIARGRGCAGPKSLTSLSQ
jgi:hypothetical protein